MSTETELQRAERRLAETRAVLAAFPDARREGEVGWTSDHVIRSTSAAAAIGEVYSSGRYGYEYVNVYVAVDVPGYKPVRVYQREPSGLAGGHEIPTRSLIRVLFTNPAATRVLTDAAIEYARAERMKYPGWTK